MLYPVLSLSYFIMHKRSILRGIRGRSGFEDWYHLLPLVLSSRLTMQDRSLAILPFMFIVSPLGGATRHEMSPVESDACLLI